MNNISVFQKADEYLKWVESGQKTEISEHVKELGERWTLLFNFIQNHSTERDALIKYMAHKKVDEDTARRDLSIVQRLWGKFKMPNRNFEIIKNLNKIDKQIKIEEDSNTPDRDRILKLLKLRVELVDKLPEEVEPPNKEKYNQKRRFSPDPEVLMSGGKEKMAKAVETFDKIKKRYSRNYEGFTEDATIIQH